MTGHFIKSRYGEALKCVPSCSIAKVRKKQVKGGKEVTLTPGQTVYEGPDDIHVIGRNASKTKPAKFVVFLVKKKGARALVPVK
jgi:hypothetical protein